MDGKPTVGAGPYLVAERKVGQFTRLVANPNYYRGKPAVDEIVFKNYANPDALGQALKKGEIDYANRPAAQRLRLPCRHAEHRTQVGRSTRDSTSWPSTPGPRW